jgi:hypothetical protein
LWEKGIESGVVCDEDEVMEDDGPCCDLDPARKGFMDTGGVLVPSEDSSPSRVLAPLSLVPGLVGADATSDSVEACWALLRVAAPRVGSNEAEPCSCSTSSSHFTDKVELGRSARSARLRHSLVRSCRATHI